LFLDEIGDLPIMTQGKLLRAIESRKIERLGSNKAIDLDVRFISATNKDLSKAILEGGFREDLLYRINTLTLEIPPLRDRREDLPALIDFFIRKTETDQKKKVVKVEGEVMDFLLSYNYPGNIRELKNVIERMITLSRDGIITIKDMLMPIDCKPSNQNNTIIEKSLKKARDSFERNFIQEALTANKGNVTKTSEELKISTRQLWNKINQYKIDLGTVNKNSL
jgi:transcriptional regulator with PAS, ATPase and Fis domain